ncbi:hypothetical protein B7P43_G04312 [Cryptotermes secundus]|nr:hypothetical protein B7P43_G04312 [Cryptotermes secundus]
MKSTRAKHRSLIVNHKRKLEDKEKENLISRSSERKSMMASNDDDIADTFHNIIAPKKRKHDSQTVRKEKKRKVLVDEMHYIPYTAPDHHTEQGFSVNNFELEASKAKLDLTADSEETLRQQQKLKHWDRKKKKMVAVNMDKKVKKIRDESGAWIPATYKSKRYAQWKERMKVEEDFAADSEDDGDDDHGDQKRNQLRGLKTYPNTHWGRHNKKVENKVKSELKRPDQILKARIEQEKKKRKQRRKCKRSKRKK